MAAVSNSMQKLITCTNCNVSHDEEVLYICVKPNCAKYREPLCQDCGESVHKRKNHKFDIEKDFIQPLDLTTIQQKIDVKSYAFNKIPFAFIHIFVMKGW